MTNSSKQHIQNKIQFLEDQLASLNHFLPETYDYLMRELDLQKREYAEIVVSEYFSTVNQERAR